MSMILEELEAKPTLQLLLKGQVVGDERLIKLLVLIEREGSILKAAKKIGLAYSSAWDLITKAERLLGIRLVEAKRGGRKGGGAKLTQYGRQLVEKYCSEYYKYFRRPLAIDAEKHIILPELAYAGSHDLGVEYLLGMLKEKHPDTLIEVAWVGSTAGILSLLVGEADIVGIHLYDPEKKEYNKPFIAKLGLKEKVVLVRGYDREVGFAYKCELGDPLKALQEGRARIAARNPGSGTRILLDNILREVASGPIEYTVEANTHVEVVEKIVVGEADVGLTLRHLAEQYNLCFKPVKWEQFDILVNKNSLSKRIVKELLGILKSREFRQKLETLRGYRVPPNIGEVIA